MPRARLGVALLVPPPVREEIDGLRRACGDGARLKVPPHLTLVPPVNVSEAHLGAVLAVLRAAAAGVAGGALDLHLGPPATFHPASPVLYLAVGRDDRELAPLARLRDAVFTGPLERPLTFPFVPHVTLCDDMAVERLPAAVAGLADFGVDVSFDRIHLLHEGGARVWQPIADVPFGEPAVVGRGGLPVELLVTDLVDPEAATFVARAEDVPAGARPIAVTARLDGRAIGAVAGWTRDGECVLTAAGADPDAAGPGGLDVEHHLRAAADLEAAQRARRRRRT